MSNVEFTIRWSRAIKALSLLKRYINKLESGQVATAVKQPGALSKEVGSPKKLSSRLEWSASLTAGKAIHLVGGVMAIQFDQFWMFRQFGIAEVSQRTILGGFRLPSILLGMQRFKNELLQK